MLVKATRCCCAPIRTAKTSNAGEDAEQQELTHSLPAGMRNGAVTSANSLVISTKLIILLLHNPAIVLLGIDQKS